VAWDLCPVCDGSGEDDVVLGMSCFYCHGLCFVNTGREDDELDDDLEPNDDDANPASGLSESLHISWSRRSWSGVQGATQCHGARLSRKRKPLARL